MSPVEKETSNKCEDDTNGATEIAQLHHSITSSTNTGHICFRSLLQKGPQAPR